MAFNQGIGGWFLDSAGATTRKTFRLVRAEDQLIVVVDLLDAKVSGTDIVADGPNPGLRFTLGSQHTVEQAIDGEPTYPNPPVPGAGAANHRSAEPSRIVVDLNLPIAFTLASILNLVDKVPRIDGRADTSVANPPSLTTVPADDVTAIEIPADLVLSPNDNGRWITDSTPQTVDNVTEAWRIRLARRVGGQAIELPEVFGVGRAIYTAGDTTPALAVPDTGDRADIVGLSAHQTAPVDDISFLPIGRLWLSPAGGRFETEVAFKTPNAPSLSAWRQKVVTGRDVQAAIVKQGYILPWGLPASVIEQTERQFVTDSGGGISAVMVRLDYLITSAEERPTPAGAKNDGRGAPFPNTQLDTIDATAINRGIIVGTSEDDAFWVELAGGSNPLMQIPVTLTDEAGKKHRTTAAGIWVRESVAYGAGAGTVAFQAVSEWNSRTDTDRDMNMHGDQVAWAPERDPGAATRSTETIRMHAYHRNDGADPANLIAAFGPEVEKAWIVDEVTSGLAGATGSAIEVVPNLDYKDHGDTNGSGQNPAGNFLDIAGSFVQGALTGDGGSMVAPSFDFQGLSQSFGTGPSLGAGGSWFPSVELAGLGGKLLGVVDLLDILPIDVSLVGNGVDQLEIPRIVVEPPNLSIPEEVCYRFEWSTTLESWNDIFISAQDIAAFSGDTTMDFEATTCISTADAEPSASLDVRIQDFGIQLPPGLPAVLVTFRDLRYEQQAGQDADVTVKVKDVEFVGILGFLEPIAGLLGNLTDSLGIDVDFEGVNVDTRIPIPDINLGVMGISDLEPAFGLTLPFDGSPVGMNLSIGTQQAPFSVFVLSAGGTGYLEIDASATDITRLAAGFAVSFEWGVNVVVAKVSITGTIGGGIEYQNGDIEFTIFIAIKGTVAAFGLSAWLECRLALSYQTANELLTGSCKVTVGFDTPIGSQSVSFQLEQSISLGDGSPAGMSFLRGGPAALMGATGPSFGDRFTSTQWTDYCGAFA